MAENTAEPGIPLWLQTVGIHPASLPRIEDLPWAIIEPFEERAKANHHQSLKTLRSRGGLSVAEAVAILEDRPWSPMPVALALARLEAYVVAINALAARDVS